MRKVRFGKERRHAGKTEAETDLAAPQLARRGFIKAAGTSALGLTALGYVAKEARGSTYNPDLTRAPTTNPDSAYPEWFPSWSKIEQMAKKEGQVQVSAWGSAAAKDHFNKMCAMFERKYAIKTTYRHGDWFSAQQQVLNDVKEKKEKGSIDCIFQWGKPLSNLMQGGGVWEVPFFNLLPNARKVPYRPELGLFVHDMVPTYGSFVPHMAIQDCFVYNKKKLKLSDIPQTVDGVLDWAKKNKGKFTYCDLNKGGSGHTWAMMLIYQLTGGYEKYAFKPFNKAVADKDWGPLWAYLKELEQYLYRPGTYPQGNNAVAQLFAAEEILLCPNWDVTMFETIAGGQCDPEIVGMFVPTPGIYSPADGFTIPVNAPNKAAALLFLDFVTSVEAQVEMVNTLGCYPVTTEAWDRIPEKERKQPWHPVADLRNWRDLGTIGGRHGEYMFHMMTEWVDRVARK